MKFYDWKKYIFKLDGKLKGQGTLSSEVLLEIQLLCNLAARNISNAFEKMKRLLTYTTRIHGEDHHEILLTSGSYDLLFLERKMTQAMLNNLFSTAKFKTLYKPIYRKAVTCMYILTNLIKRSA
jgi:hypothetical protein